MKYFVFFIIIALLLALACSNDFGNDINSERKSELMELDSIYFEIDVEYIQRKIGPTNIYEDMFFETEFLGKKFKKYYLSNILKSFDSDIEIGYSSLDNDETYLIVIRNFTPDYLNFKAFYLKWENNLIEEKGKNKTWDKKYKTWGIDETTKFVTTNLPLKLVKKLYPKFDGEYNKVVLEKIIIDKSQYATYLPEFYNAIKYIE